eukprot:m.1076030 g.1076030  ORF g.1076030 m.1076030 type:complete len:1086 (-) comp24246_c0_seq1:37-3294(-)
MASPRDPHTRRLVDQVLREKEYVQLELDQAYENIERLQKLCASHERNERRFTQEIKSIELKHEKHVEKLLHTGRVDMAKEVKVRREREATVQLLERELSRLRRAQFMGASATPSYSSKRAVSRGSAGSRSSRRVAASSASPDWDDAFATAIISDDKHRTGDKRSSGNKRSAEDKQAQDGEADRTPNNAGVSAILISENRRLKERITELEDKQRQATESFLKAEDHFNRSIQQQRPGDALLPPKPSTSTNGPTSKLASKTSDTAKASKAELNRAKAEVTRLQDELDRAEHKIKDLSMEVFRAKEDAKVATRKHTSTKAELQRLKTSMSGGETSGGSHSTKSDLRKAEKELATLRKELARAKTETEKLRLDAKSATAAAAVHNTRELTAMKEELSKARHELDSKTAAHDKKIRALKTEAAKQEETHTRALTKVRDELKKVKRDHASAGEKETEALKTQISNLKATSARYKEASDQARAAQSQAAAEGTRLAALVRDAEAKETQARQDAGGLRLELSDVKAQSSALEANLASAVSGALDVTEKLAAATSRVEDLEAQLEDHDAHGSVTAKVADLEAQLDSAQDTVTTLTQQNMDASKEIAVLNSELAQVRIANDTLEKELAELSAASSSAAAKTQSPIEAEKPASPSPDNDTVRLLDAQLVTKTHEVERLTRTMDMLKNEHAHELLTVRSTIRELEAAVESAQASCARKDAALQTARDTIDVQGTDIDTAVDTVQRVGELKQRLDDQAVEHQRATDALQTAHKERVALLEATIATLEARLHTSPPPAPAATVTQKPRAETAVPTSVPPSVAPSVPPSAPLSVPEAVPAKAKQRRGSGRRQKKSAAPVQAAAALARTMDARIDMDKLMADIKAVVGDLYGYGEFIGTIRADITVETAEEDEEGNLQVCDFHKGDVVRVIGEATDADGDAAVEMLSLAGKSSGDVIAVPEDVIEALAEDAASAALEAMLRHNVALPSTLMYFLRTQNDVEDIQAIAIALYDYDPMEQSMNDAPEMELRLRTGELVYLLSEAQDGYFDARIANHGWGEVPANFLALVDEDTLYDSSASKVDCHIIASDKHVSIPRTKIISS